MIRFTINSSRMYFKSFITSFFILAGITLSAQDVIVKGNIFSSDHVPILDAEIKSANTNITSSDKFGSFEITAPLNSVIIISKNGFIPYQFKVEEKISQVMIRLEREYKVITG